MSPRRKAIRLLCEIPLVGQARASALLDEFGGIKTVIGTAARCPERFVGIHGIDRAMARVIVRYIESNRTRWMRELE